VSDLDILRRTAKRGLKAAQECDSQFVDVFQHMLDEIQRVQDTDWKALLEHKQYLIDSLMLEHCPDEMTQEQKDNWASHQQVAKEKSNGI
jgi:hypothetical protein